MPSEPNDGLLPGTYGAPADASETLAIQALVNGLTEHFRPMRDEARQCGEFNADNMIMSACAVFAGCLLGEQLGTGQLASESRAKCIEVLALNLNVGVEAGIAKATREAATVQ